jgi:flavin-dependent dehydrogenase
MKKDVLIVGARCAGAPLAMLLARRGLAVTAYDKCAFPSDAISTHFIWPIGVAALHRWAIWASILAAWPAICHKAYSSAPDGELVGPLHEVDGVNYAISLRRFKLDALLVKAARQAGAEIREHSAIDELIVEDSRVAGVRGHDIASGVHFEERAAIVVGADGKDSFVAREVAAPKYNEAPSLTASYYTYVVDEETDPDMLEVYRRPPREFVLFPTDGGLTMVNLVIGAALVPEFRKRVTANFFAAFDECPGLAKRLRRAKRVAPIKGSVHMPNYYRQSYGPGWALVGDAGYHRDPIRAQGIHDAFLDAEDLAAAIERGLMHTGSMEIALRERQEKRDDRTRSPYELAVKAAGFEDSDVGRSMELLASIKDNPTLIGEFRGLISGSMRPEVFFDPDHIRTVIERTKRLEPPA